MDNRGYWHDVKENGVVDEVIEPGSTARKFVAAIGLGEVVTVVKNGGDFAKFTFDKAERNKVTLTPTEVGSGQPYFELAEPVQIQTNEGKSLNARVWDNRNGKLILKTLPVS